MTENCIGLCFRCDHRAVFLETGHGPRSECKDTNNAINGCYMYKPTAPNLLKKDPSDKRPQFAGPAFSSRSRSGGFSDCRLNLEQSKEGATLYWTPKSLDNAHMKARDTIWFLECHPALGGSAFGLFSLLQVQIEKVDKKGRIEPHKGQEDVYWSRENYKKFKEEFDKEFKDCAPDELNRKSLISIQVPYERVYGEKWTFDHVEYWGELSITAFMGKKFDGGFDPKKWQFLSGIETGGRSFEEMMINIGVQFKRNYGNFSGQDFLTAKEKKNNKNKEMFLFKDSSTPNTKIMVRNPEYIHVGAAELNRRWWQWFSETPLCKRHWGETTDQILSGKELF